MEKFKINARRITGVMLCLAMLLAGLHPLRTASAETLADIDAQIRSDSTLVRIPGQAAYNVYAGITDARLDRKIAVLNAAGIMNFAYAGNYANFYSFTGLAGFTDTKIDMVTTTSTLRLYRRGAGSRQETQSRLGSWWSESYLGIEATRNELAVLAAWGNDLNRVYVIDMPAGTTLVGGLASPMEQGGEYRPGGTYQYYYRGIPLNWLVYAFYAPDYLKSYAAAITGAQRLGRSSVKDIGTHLDDLRYQILIKAKADANAGEPEGPAAKPALYRGNQFADGGKVNDYELPNTWFRFYGDYSRMHDGGESVQKSQGMHVGWDKLIRGGASGERDRWYIGALLGQGMLEQEDAFSHVKNDITDTYAGIYSLYQSRPGRLRSWYGEATILYGHLKFANQVPGELAGCGFSQNYAGNMLIASLENGVTFRRPGGWFIEPQMQLFYTHVLQNNFVDNLGATVIVRRGTSLTGCLGLMVLRKTETKDGRRRELWARANYQREFCGENRIDVAGDEAVSGAGRNVYQLNAGANFDLTRYLSIRGDISKNFGDEHGYCGSISLLRSW